jgi:ABC-type multidrug transport system fused ATPase/permease subunit
MPDSNILAFLFSTIATIVATLTGLIGAFATFKLQKFESKLDFLKDYTLHKELDEAKTLNTKIRENHYASIRIIYLHNMAAIEELKSCIQKFDYHNHTEEYEHDIENITSFQKQYDEIRQYSKKEFTKSIVFVTLCLVGLLFTNTLLHAAFLWVILAFYFYGLIYIFSLFIKQIKQLMA